MYQGGYGVKRHFQQYFSYIVAVGFIGGGNRSTQRKRPTGRKSLTKFIMYRLHLAWAGLMYQTDVYDVVSQYWNDNGITAGELFCIYSYCNTGFET